MARRQLTTGCINKAEFYSSRFWIARVDQNPALKIIGKWRWHSVNGIYSIFHHQLCFPANCDLGKSGKAFRIICIYYEYIYIYVCLYIYMKLRSHMIPQIVHDDCKFHCCAHSHWLQPPFRKSNAEGIKMWEPPYIWVSQYTNEQQTSSQSQVNV